MQATLPQEHLCAPTPHRPHLPLEVQTALPKLVPLLGLLTYEIVPAGLRRWGGQW